MRIRALARGVCRTGLLLVLASPAQGQSPLDSLPAFADTTLSIPMRDGILLNTRIFTPREPGGPLPIILLRTPYGIAHAENNFRAYLRDLARDGYIFVFQDIRGRYASQGEFIMNRPLHDPADPNGVDESTDAWDTIDWLVKHLPGNNGKVGVLGISYPGWLAGMAAVHPHPALRAVSPQAPMTDTWLGDDFFHNGAFRLGYGFEYASMMELSNDQSVPPPVGRYDTYDWYLSLGSLRHVGDSILQGRVPSWADFVAHPAYDGFWQARALQRILTAPTVPTLTVAGWWDQEDFTGPTLLYAAMEPHDTGNISFNFFVAGPWNHGGWRGEGRTLGNIDFGTATGKYFREEVQAPWFAVWLKGQGTLPFSGALVFESGSNQWRHFYRWPPAEAKATNLYFQAGGRLDFTPPPAAPRLAHDQYVADPAHPIPYRQRPIQWVYNPTGSGWYSWLTEDQRFVDGRPDVLTWQTAPLTGDVAIAGDITGHLFAATTGSDADWVVKLIDVYPDSVAGDPKLGGYELIVASEILRGRYRRSFEHPQPITPGAVLEYVVPLRQQSYRFLKGHRIMVQVQSSWFPAYDRNPQTYVPDIFLADPAAFRSRTHSIYRSAAYPSHLTIPVLADQ